MTVKLSLDADTPNVKLWLDGRKVPAMTSKDVDKSGDVENPVSNPVRTQPGKNGGTLKVGGVNPGSGRPPDAWKALCADMADRGAKAALAQKVLETPEHPAWLGAWKFVAEQAHGKAAQTIKGDPDHPLKFEVVRERKRRERTDD